MTGKIADVIPGIYRNFLGEKVEILGVGINVDSLEKLIVFRPLSKIKRTFAFHFRPLDHFFTQEDLGEGKMVKRYTLLSKPRKSVKR